jgi:hypothetical protein
MLVNYYYYYSSEITTIKDLLIVIGYHVRFISNTKKNRYNEYYIKNFTGYYYIIYCS